MKLTAQFTQNAPSYINAIGQRELLLRGHQIAIIENIPNITIHDSIDLTDNDIRVLGGFAESKRLKTLLISNNRISHIAVDLPSRLPNLENVALAANSFSELSELVALGGLQRLTQLCLIGNPVTNRDHYRLFVVWQVPSLRILDLEKIKDREREQAKKMFGTHDQPTELAQSIMGSKSLKAGLTSGLQKSFARTLTEQEKESLRQQLKTAPTLAEVQRIEEQLQMAS